MSLFHPDFLIQYSDENLKTQLKEKNNSINHLQNKFNKIEKKYKKDK